MSLKKFFFTLVAAFIVVAIVFSLGWRYKDVLGNAFDAIVTYYFPWNFIVLGYILVWLIGGGVLKSINISPDKKQRIKNLVIVITAVVGLGFALSYHNGATPKDEKKETKQTTEQVAQPATKTPIKEVPQEEEGLSLWGKAGALVILLIALGIIARQVYNDGGGDWKKILSSPVTIAAIAVVLVNVFAALGIPKWWLKFWDQHMFFFLANTGTIVAVHFYSKGSPWAKAVAVLVSTIVVASGLNTYFTAPNFSWGRNQSKSSKEIAGISLSQRVPIEVARRVVCECESGCRQFEDDGKTPFKNRGIPDKGIPPSTAFGKYQFLEGHREIAKKLGFDLNTEDGQDQYFDYLYTKEGFGPWLHDEQYGGGAVCLAPKLAEYGFKPEGQSRRVILAEGPVGKFGEITKLDPKQGKADFFGGGKKYTVLWNGTVQEDLPRSEGVASLTPAVTYFFQVKSREEKPVKITVVVGNN